MGPKVKQITLWNQSSKCNFFYLLESGLERIGYRQYQFYPCIFYRKDLVILTYVDDCLIVSHRQETITSLI